MSELSAAERNALPREAFGLPDARAYPVDTPERAINAKARASEEFNAGKLTDGEKKRIDAKADAALRHADFVAGWGDARD